MDGITPTAEDVSRLIEEKNRLVRENYRLRKALRAIGECDCLNPPWLRQLVDDALADGE